jgi:hypothetical protein
MTFKNHRNIFEILSEFNGKSKQIGGIEKN